MPLTYIGNIERIQTGASIEWKRYVGGAIFTYKTSANNTLQLTDKRYLYNDHLGSLDVITDAVGRVTHSESFDPWGARRGGEDWKTFVPSSLSIASFDRPITQRGFTGHEMVDDMNIIHMNGRIYDSRLGRFLQADPHIDGAADTQGYNRYSYVHNNPLNAIDPSGFSAWTRFTSAIRPYVGAIVAIGMTILAPEGAGFWYATLTGAVSGAAGAAANGGNILQGALTGALSAAAFYGVGTAFQGAQGTGSAFGTHLSYTAFAEKVFAHGMVGGVMSVLQGGKFGNGFASAGVTQAFSGAIDSIGGNSNSSAYFDAANRGLRIAAAAVVGGTASELSGGKFANGAITGAFSRAFNDEQQHNQKSLAERNEAWRAKNQPSYGEVLKDIFGSELPNWLEESFIPTREDLPPITLYTGGTLILAGGPGEAAGMGSYFTTQNGANGFEFGRYDLTGPVIGVNVDASLTWGITLGPLSSFQGAGQSIDLDFGRLALNINFDGNQQFSGGSISLGTSYIRNSASVYETGTKTTPYFSF